MATDNSPSSALQALAFAARRQRDQRRKALRSTPCINHPIARADAEPGAAFGPRIADDGVYAQLSGHERDDDGNVRLGRPRDHTAAWARILEDGKIELELYDFGGQAMSEFGNDVAWLYRIGVDDKPKLIETLSEYAGRAIEDDDELLDAMAWHFEHVHAVRDWIRSMGIALDEEFVAWP